MACAHDDRGIGGAGAREHQRWSRQSIGSGHGCDAITRHGGVECRAQFGSRGDDHLAAVRLRRLRGSRRVTSSTRPLRQIRYGDGAAAIRAMQHVRDEPTGSRDDRVVPRRAMLDVASQQPWRDVRSIGDDDRDCGERQQDDERNGDNP
ncbi:MAG: hypothetical protein ABI881_08735 [Betaproteobacteria bacterium]